MKNLLPIAVAAALLAACSTPANVAYFQDTDQAEGAKVEGNKNILLQPGDQVSIIVNTASPKLTELFNLAYTSHRIGQNADLTVTGTTVSNGQISGYTVNENGYIDFPVLGELKVEGLNREQVAALVRDQLQEQGQANDAVVTVEFMNLSYEVLGEVARPGRFAITKDGMTVLDAIGSAGDLTIQGDREKVKVLRLEDGAQKTYNLDLCYVLNGTSSATGVYGHYGRYGHYGYYGSKA